MNESSKNSFPSFVSLLSRAWGIFKNIFINLFIFTIVLQVLVFVLSFFAQILFGVNLLSDFLQGVPQKNLITIAFSSHSPGITLILLACFAYFAVIVLSFIINIGNTLIVAGYKDKFSFANIFNRSLNLVLPFFIVSVLFGIIVLGGFFVFIIPAFIFGFIFMFYSYEVILNNKKGMEALKGSLAIVNDNFGSIFVRLLLLLLSYIGLLVVYLIAAFIFTKIGSSFSLDIQSFKIMFGLLSTLAGWIIGWVVLIFSFVLYDEAKARTNFGEAVKMKWVWIISIIGWIIGLILLISTLTLAPNFIKSFQDSFKGQNSVTSAPLSGKSLESADVLIKSSKFKLDKANQLAKDISAKGRKPTEQEQAEITKLIQGAINDSKLTTEMYPDNPYVWYYRGTVYRSLIGFSENAERFAIESYKKAIELKPDDYVYVLELGGTYYQIKDYNNALINFQTVVMLNPKYANGYYNLAMTYKLLGNKVEARKAFQKVLDLLLPNDPGRSLIEQELQNL